MKYKIVYGVPKSSDYPCKATAYNEKGRLVQLCVGDSWHDVRNRIKIRLDRQPPKDEYYEVN